MSWILARSQLLGSGSSDMSVVLAWLSSMVLRRTSMLEPEVFCWKRSGLGLDVEIRVRLGLWAGLIGLVISALWSLVKQIRVLVPVRLSCFELRTC